MTGGEKFNSCPINSIKNNPEVMAIFELYEECCGLQIRNPIGIYHDKGGNGQLLESAAPIKFLPFPGSINEQPAHIMEAFKIIANKIQSII